MKKIVGASAACFFLGLSILNITTVNGQVIDSNNETSQDVKTVLISSENEKKDNVEVEVIFNAYDEDFIKELTLEDGTKVKDHNYTITYAANPRYSISQYLNYGAWITRNGVVSLSMDPTDKVRTNRSTKNTAWGVISSKTQGFASDSRWKNDQVMKWQWDCHFDFAGKKDYWNLEPHRTADSYIFGVVLKACNP